MSQPVDPTGLDKVVHVRVPFSIRKRGGRKLVLVPGGAAATRDRLRIDNAMVKALARAFRWRKLLEGGAYGTIQELAATEKINASYVSRILRLTLLAPEIVGLILDGRQEPDISLSKIMEPFPLTWAGQTAVFLKPKHRHESRKLHSC